VALKATAVEAQILESLFFFGFFPVFFEGWGVLLRVNVLGHCSKCCVVKCTRVLTFQKKKSQYPSTFYYTTFTTVS